MKTLFPCLFLCLTVLLRCAEGENPFSLILDARKLFNSGEPASAVKLLNRAMILDPGIPYTYYYLGKCYEALKDQHSSLKYYKLYLKQFPGSDDTMELQGIDHSVVRERAGDLGETSRRAQELYRQARNQLESGAFSQAAAYLEEAVTLSPGEIRFHELLARVYRDLHDSRTAIVWYEKALQIAPQDKSLWQEYFIYLDSTGAAERALAAGKRLLTLDPSNQQVRERIAALSTADQPLAAHCLVWKRAGSLVIVEHNLDSPERSVDLIGKEIEVYRGEVSLQNPATGEFIDSTPDTIVGRIRIVELRRKVIHAIILSESDCIGVGDYVMLDR